jgi:uncharacterized protein YjbJ (UPF0337 family)
MQWDQIESHWKEFAGSARAHWGKLTDDDWHAMTGTRGHLIGRIHKRYEVTREEAERQVEDWSDALLDIVGASTTH